MYPILLLSVLGIVVLYLGFAKSKNILLPSTLFFLAVTFAANFLKLNQRPQH
jgi:NADH-quinone oxidoreductase subunit N